MRTEDRTTGTQAKKPKKKQIRNETETVREQGESETVEGGWVFNICFLGNQQTIPTFETPVIVSSPPLQQLLVPHLLQWQSDGEPNAH